MAVTDYVKSLERERDEAALKVKQLSVKIAQARSGDVTQDAPDEAASREDVAEGARYGSVASREDTRPETDREEDARKALESKERKDKRSK